MKRPILIGIAGGTGSGKSTVANQIYNNFDKKDIAMIEQDSYYKDQSNLSFEERKKTNYDHPDAFDTSLFINHLKQLINGNTIDKPSYDFERHNRKKEVVKVEPKNIIIVEGILLFYDIRVRDLLDIKIYVDTDADVRIIRRIQRDLDERGRTLDSVINQYLNVVRPMHLQFVEPTKKYADIVIPQGGYNKVAIDLITANINHMLQNYD